MNTLFSNKKPHVSHFKKEIVFHLEEALKAAEGLVERNSIEGNQNTQKGLELFIHNMKARF